MGGLLSADAFKYLYKLDDADLDGTRSLASRIYKSLFTYQKSSSTSHTEDEMRSLVNISAILAFDSPYFGLHQNVITRTGLQKAKDAVPKELPPISGILGPAINGAVEHLIPNKVLYYTIQNTLTLDYKIIKVSLPIGTDISTQSLKETLKSNLTASSTDGSSSTAHPDPSALLDLGPTNLDLRKLTTGSIVVAPVILSTPAVGMTLAATAADRLVSLSQFLSPLLSSTSSSRARLGHLSRLHQSSSLYFRAYYNVLGHALLAHPQPTSACKTFCIQPLSHTLHFQPLPSPLSDEIDAHMFLFDAQEVGGEHYAWLLDTVAADILAAFTHVDVDAAANE